MSVTSNANIKEAFREAVADCCHIIVEVDELEKRWKVADKTDGGFRGTSKSAIETRNKIDRKFMEYYMPGVFALIIGGIVGGLLARIPFFTNTMGWIVGGNNRRCSVHFRDSSTVKETSEILYGVD